MIHMKAPSGSGSLTLCSHGLRADDDLADNWDAVTCGGCMLAAEADPISRNNYYDRGGIPVIDVIRAKLTPEQYEGYLLGNTIKYALRLNWKGNRKSDADKLAEYAVWLSEHLARE